MHVPEPRQKPPDQGDEVVEQGAHCLAESRATTSDIESKGYAADNAGGDSLFDHRPETPGHGLLGPTSHAKPTDSVREVVELHRALSCLDPVLVNRLPVPSQPALNDHAYAICPQNAIKANGAGRKFV